MWSEPSTGSSGVSAGTPPSRLHFSTEGGTIRLPHRVERTYNERATAKVGRMPLSEHEQRILEDIERRLEEDDPRFAQQVARSSLHSHVARRLRWGGLLFLTGFVLLMLF